MKRFLLVLLSLTTIITISAQELTVKSLVQTNDAIARSRNVKGTDGNVCAAVVVRIPSSNATFDGGFIIGKPAYKNGEYIIDMQTGAAQMRVSVPGYNTIDVKFRDYLGSTLQSKITYLLTINMPQSSAQQKKQTLNIKVTPVDAVVLIDNEMVEERIIELPIGSHSYNVAANGYLAQSGNVNLTGSAPGKLIIELDRKQTAAQSNNTVVAVPQQQVVQQTQQPAQPVQQPAQPSQPVQQQVMSNVGMTPQTFTVHGVSFTMMPVEGGTFTMGATAEQGSDAFDDEKPAHQVTLSSYYIGKYEVTQELWKAVMGKKPSKFKGSRRPVEQVSWKDCQTFISKLNTITDKRFRLPTEAEWEFASRGGNKSQGYKYSGSNTIDDVAWYGNNSGHTTHDVGTKSPNELGIYDMSGNVWELCQDWKGDYSSSSQTNPTGANSGSFRVRRGGGWDSNARCCRSSLRYGWSPDSWFNYLGLRLVLSE